MQDRLNRCRGSTWFQPSSEGQVPETFEPFNLSRMIGHTFYVMRISWPIYVPMANWWCTICLLFIRYSKEFTPALVFRFDIGRYGNIMWLSNTQNAKSKRCLLKFKFKEVNSKRIMSVTVSHGRWVFSAFEIQLITLLSKLDAHGLSATFHIFKLILSISIDPRGVNDGGFGLISSSFFFGRESPLASEFSQHLKLK